MSKMGKGWRLAHLKSVLMALEAELKIHTKLENNQRVWEIEEDIEKVKQQIYELTGEQND